MKKYGKLIALIVIVLGTVAFLFHKQIAALFQKKQPETPNQQPGTGTTTATNTGVNGGNQPKTPNPQPGTNTAGAVNYDRLLYKGVNDAAAVKILQGYLGVTQDGDFGPQTETALFNKIGEKSVTLNVYRITQLNLPALSSAPTSGLAVLDFFNPFSWVNS